MMETLMTQPKSFSETTSHPLCPTCGNFMAEADSVRENGFSFIWYECPDANCGGQWLEKKALSGKGHRRDTV